MQFVCLTKKQHASQISQLILMILATTTRLTLSGMLGMVIRMKITVGHAQFANLEVRRYVNSDGVGQANELFTLNTLGITALDTATRQAVNAT